jgi:hypothetical protein
MFNRVYDGIKLPPAVSLTNEELQQIAYQIEAGDLPPNYLDLHFDNVDASVFGVDAPRNRHGQRQEQGLGSENNMTRQSIDAYRRWCKDEPDFEKTVIKMEKQLVACNEKRKVGAAASPKKWMR